MTKIVLILSFLFSGYAAVDGLAQTDTSRQAMQDRLEKMEKKISLLQTEIKSIRTETPRKIQPGARKRVMVIDRRGSKQVYLQ